MRWCLSLVLWQHDLCRSTSGTLTGSRALPPARPFLAGRRGECAHGRSRKSRRHHMTDREAAAQSFEAAGWAIREKHPLEEEGPSARPAGTLSGPPRRSWAQKRVRAPRRRAKHEGIRAQGPLPGTGLGVDRGVRCPSGDFGRNPGKVPMVPPGTEEDR